MRKLKIKILLKLLKMLWHKLKEGKHNVVIVDTAGRLAIDEAMMNEIRTLHQTLKLRNLICC